MLCAASGKRGRGVRDDSGVVNIDAADLALEEGPPSAPANALRFGPALVAATALAACSGGGSVTSGSGSGSTGGTGTGTGGGSTGGTSITSAQASRFLAQATFGATKTDISTVQSRGYSGWITDQIALPRTSHWDWLVSNGYNAAANINGTAGFDNSVWRQIITEPGQLRQRVGMALSEILVVGIGGLQVNWKAFASAAYLDVLLDGAFGNFRTLLTNITTNAAMASFLTFLGNRKANANTGAVPDENYAREIMQLFTIGLYRLNADGSQQLSGGQPVETYTQNDVSQLARVFTGLVLDSSDSTTPDRYRRPLIMDASRHETGASSFLGASVPAGTEGMAAIGIALDTLFAHPNLPPFLSRQLIQRLVTSNPSPAYVGRVAAVFVNNGSGTRGDLGAVVRAILLDSEARNDPAQSGNSVGKLREPIMRLTAWARAYGATSTSGTWPIGDTSSTSTRLAQSFGRSPSVFNFFRPGYTPPNTALANNNLVAPELQITDEISVVGYVNFMRGLVQAATSDVTADYGALTALATDSQALVDEVNLVLAAGQLSATTVMMIRSAVDSISTTATNAALNRAMTAVLLTLAAPEFITLR